MIWFQLADDPQHEITVMRLMAAFRAICSCGRFEAARDTELGAVAAGRDHVRAQLGLAHISTDGEYIDGY